MIRRDRSKSHATPTARVRRRQEAALHEEQLRAAEASGSDGTVARRRTVPIKAVLLVGVLLILIIAVIGGILLYGRVSAFNDKVSTRPVMSSTLWGPLGGEGRINVAVIGYGGKQHRSGNFLADSIQIMSIDPVADTTTVIPIPRDLWVEGIADLPDTGKINEAFAIGHAAGGVREGARQLTRVLSEVTGLRIRYWMAMDFDSFKEMVNAVGGVTINNPRAFQFTRSERLYRMGVWNRGSFAKGELQLDGAQALDYARARYTSDPRESSDFARSQRQARILSALRDKIGDGGLGSIGPGLGMMDALQGNLRTNVSAFDLFLLSGHLRPDRRIELKEGRVLEATTNTIGQYILVVVGRADSTDYTPLQQYLQRQLAKPIVSPSASPS